MSLKSTTFQLKSGLQVIHISKEQEIGVRVQLTYNFGSNGEEEIENYGWAHVVEHMIFKGTEQPGRMRVKELNDIIEQIDEKSSLAGLGFQLDDKLEEMKSEWENWEKINRNEEWITFEERLELFLPIIITEHETKKGIEFLPLDILCDLLVSLKLFYLSETDINSLARQYGAIDNAFTSRTQTSYFFESGKNALPLFLTILGQCMNHASMKDEHLRSEILAVLQEMSKDNVSIFRAEYNEMLKTAFGEHYPEFSHSTIGTTKALESISGEKLKEWYKKHYRPENAKLLVLTPILTTEEENRMISTIEVAFESSVDESTKSQDGSVDKQIQNSKTQQNELKKHRYHTPSWVDEYEDFSVLDEEHVRRIVYHQCASSDDLLLCWPLPVSPNLFGVGDLFAFILSHGVEGRLNIALRGEVSSVNAWWDQTNRHSLLFVSFHPLRNRRGYPGVEDLITFVQNAIKKPLTEEEIDRALLRAEGEHIHKQDSLSSIASSVVECLNAYNGSSVSELQNHIDLHCLGNKPNVSKKKLLALHQSCAEMVEGYYGIHMKPPTQKIKQDLEQKLEKTMKDFVSFTKNYERKTPLEGPFLFEHLFQYEHTPAIYIHDLKEQLISPHSHFLSYSIRLHSQNPIVLLYSVTKHKILAEVFAEMLQRSSSYLSLKQKLEPYFGGLCVSATGGSIWIDTRSTAFKEKPLNKNWLQEQLHHLLLTDDLSIHSNAKKRLEEVKENLLTIFENESNQSIRVAIDYALSHELKDNLQVWTLDSKKKYIQEMTTEWNTIRDTIRRKVWSEQNTTCLQIWIKGGAKTTLCYLQKKFHDDGHPQATKVSSQSMSSKLLKEIQTHTKPPPDWIECQSQRSTVLFKTSHTCWKWTEGYEWKIERELLNSMLFGGLGSLMYQIREKTGLFYNAFGQLGFGPTDNHRINVMCVPVDPTQINNIKKEVEQQMGSVESLRSNLGESELTQAKQQLLNSAWKELICNNPEALIVSLWEHGFLQINDSYHSYWQTIQDCTNKLLDRLDKVSLDECLEKLSALESRHLNNRQFVPTMVFGPRI